MNREIKWRTKPGEPYVTIAVGDYFVVKDGHKWYFELPGGSDLEGEIKNAKKAGIGIYAIEGANYADIAREIDKALSKRTGLPDNVW